MPNTPTLSLPYPEGINTADVPRDIKALADAVDTWGEPIVTALPTANLFNGKTILYQFPAPANTPGDLSGGGGLWRLRYDTSITDAFKWRWVGGTDWHTMATYSWGPDNNLTEIDDPELKCPIVVPGYYDAWTTVFGTFYPAGPNELAALWGLTSIAGFDNWETRADGQFRMQTYVMRPIRVSVLAGASIRVRWRKGYVNDYISRVTGSALYVRPHRLGLP